MAGMAGFNDPAGGTRIQPAAPADGSYQGIAAANQGGNRLDLG
jgi:hypothetical protein